jgi:hypothetical protein
MTVIHEYWIGDYIDQTATKPKFVQLPFTLLVLLITVILCSEFSLEPHFNIFSSGWEDWGIKWRDGSPFFFQIYGCDVGEFCLHYFSKTIQAKTLTENSFVLRLKSVFP